MKKKILIIEDEIIVAKDIEQILTANGYEVVGIASNYERARIKLQTIATDLILCDINLNSNKTGLDLIEEFEARISVPFIFISAYSDSETLKKAIGLAPCNFLTKPFNEKQLLTSIQMALTEEDDEEKPSSRELSILKLLARGHGSKEIADELSISFFTVETHRKNLLKKYNVKTSAELACFATSKGWINYSSIQESNKEN